MVQGKTTTMSNGARIDKIPHQENVIFKEKVRFEYLELLETK